MLTIFLRAGILFLVAVLCMRMMGKRQVGQLQPFEFVVAIMIADLASTPMENIGTPLLHGIVPMLALTLLHSLISYFSIKSVRFRTMFCGATQVLIKDGVIQAEVMEKLCFSLYDLLEELRMGGVLNPADVGTAIMETSGKVSVFPKAECRPVNPKDLNLSPNKESFPVTMILDGKIVPSHMRMSGLTESWLLDKLKALGYSTPREVLFCSLDTSGQLMVQGREKDKVQFLDAVAPENIGW